MWWLSSVDTVQCSQCMQGAGCFHKSHGLSQFNAKWDGSISTTDRPDFYRTNVFKLKHSHCTKQLTSLCLNSKSQIYQKWKWIHFILHSIDSARETCDLIMLAPAGSAYAQISLLTWIPVSWSHILLRKTSTPPCLLFKSQLWMFCAVHRRILDILDIH